MLFEIDDPVSTCAVELVLGEQKKRQKTIGLTSGCFDLIHFHHFWYFIRCKRQCDMLIVGVDSDEMVRAEKGPERPFIFDYKRAIMVDALKPVSFTFVMNGLKDLRKAAEMFRPDILFRNDAFVGREHEVIGKEFAKGVVIIHDVEDHSSTTELSRVIAGRIKR